LFFNLDFSGLCSLEEKDAFWQVSRSEIYNALKIALNQDWMLFLPNLKIPRDQTFLEYAAKVSEVSENAESTAQITTVTSISSMTSSNLPCVAFIGKMKSGKSTATQYLCDKYGYVEYYFAKPLKLGVQQLFTLSDSQLHHVEEKNNVDPRWGVSPRYLFQQIGTDLFRNQLHKYLPQIQSCWIRNFFRWWNDNKTNGHPIVVSDCRFQNEVDAVRSVGFQTLRIVRCIPISSVSSVTQEDKHSSEQEQDNIAAQKHIENNSTLLNFFKTIDETIVNPTQERQNVE
jgi:hypothetical protein